MNNIIVFDLEATCWDNFENISRQESEIIEIGAIRVNDNYDILEEFDMFIQPAFHPAISNYCNKLTSITQVDVQTAPLFIEAMGKFETWSGDSAKFLSWGDYDRNQIVRECNWKKYKGKMPQLILNHMNVKKRISALENISGLGLGKALNRFHLQFEGKQHRGIDDTRNIVRVMQLFRGRL